MFVQSERQCFEEWNIVSHDFFVGKIKLVHNYGVDMVVGKQIICKEKKIRKPIFFFQKLNKRVFQSTQKKDSFIFFFKGTNFILDLNAFQIWR